jgi:hypothetical protein
MTTENAQTLIPKLTKDNYDSWCIRLKAFLGSQECIEIIQYGYDKPESKEVNWKANKPLELVHTDVCGPIKPMSTGQNRYFLTFIDDCSKKTWIYF